MAQDEAARLRACREAFDLSIARGVSLAEARMLLATTRWEAADARLKDRRCGTRIAVEGDGDEGGSRALQWWQRD